MTLFELFISFAKIGLLTFGGGYAMLPMLQRECVDKKKWISEEELMNYYAIGQCTPGIIAVNTATFVGLKFRGIVGGIVATLGVVFPSFIIISLLASIISMIKDNPYAVKAFSGIRIAVCALILSSIVKMIRKSKIDALWVFVASLALILQLFFAVKSIYIVLGSIVFAVLLFVVSKKRGDGK